MTLRYLAVVALALCQLTACSSRPRYAEEFEAINKGGYYWAVQSFESRARAGDNDALAYAGALTYEHLGAKQRGVAMMTLSARRGSEAAQNFLLKIGQPIPPADLRPASAGGQFTVCQATPGLPGQSVCF